ncbi:PilN family type IVB pilus formation outer membrane protein, partial [Duganella radicis]|nr:PilN family type IVB pilus formation outer membrane protein [Duganella radicis]
MMARRIAALLCALLLSACTGLAGKIDARIEETGDKASALVKETGRAAPGVVAVPPPAVTHEPGIWLGKEVVKRGAPTLPPLFYQDAAFDRTVASLSELAERISLRSGLPVKITPDAQAMLDGGVGAGAVAGAPPAAGLPPG